ncbi:MAG: hypothetical protein R6U50_13170 [Desulfobacterales bacterium]
MKRRYTFMLLTASVVFFLMMLTSGFAQVEESGQESIAEEEAGGQGGGLMNTLFKALGDAAEESLKEGIDEFIGTYKGRIGEVKLLENRGNAVVLEVTYEGVKRKDGVYVQGEVMKWSESLEGFTSTLSPIRGKKGSVVLTIGRQQQGASEWGITSSETVDESDQIRLSLVRETNPDRPFGSLVYNFEKTWTDSSDIVAAEPETAEPEEAVELAEGETAEEAETLDSGGRPPAPAVVLPGTVLKPVQTAPIKPADTAGTSIRKPSIAKVEEPASSSVRPLTTIATATKTAKRAPKTITEYHFLLHADKAQWKSSSGKLAFPGLSKDKGGYVRALDTGVICPDNKAKNLLLTTPHMVKNGTIQGVYPSIVPGKNLKFKAVGALLKGATGSDGVIMSVFVLENGSRRRVVRKTIDCSAYAHLEADLSAWAGKEIQIILHVKARNTGVRDWAVWVHPRLEQQ